MANDAKKSLIEILGKAPLNDKGYLAKFWQLQGSDDPEVQSALEGYTAMCYLAFPQLFIKDDPTKDTLARIEVVKLMYSMEMPEPVYQD